jgi:hypothetical protein
MIWTSTLKGDDKIIAYFNNTIYKGNPKEADFKAVITELENQKSIPVSLMSIPRSYLKEVNLEEGKNYIEVLFGADSSEHLKINDTDRRTEIFDFLKANIPQSTNYLDHYSTLRAGKKPLIAMAIIFALFIWTISIAVEIEQGSQYGVVGRYNSTAGIVLALASLGVTKVVLLFGSFLAIALFGLILKTRKPKVINTIKVIR